MATFGQTLWGGRSSWALEQPLQGAFSIVISFPQKDFTTLLCAYIIQLMVSDSGGVIYISTPLYPANRKGKVLTFRHFASLSLSLCACGRVGVRNLEHRPGKWIAQPKRKASAADGFGLISSSISGPSSRRFRDQGIDQLITSDGRVLKESMSVEDACLKLCLSVVELSLGPLLQACQASNTFEV